MQGQSDDYFAYAQQAVQLAERTGDAGLQIAQRAFLGYGSVLAGRLQEGLANCEWALENLPANAELGRQYSGYSPYLALLHINAWALVRSGRVVEGRSVAARAESLARDFGDIEILTWLQLANIEAATARVDAASARVHATIALASGEKTATPQSRMVSLFAHGAASRLEGNLDQAVAVLGEAVELAAAGANREFEGSARAELALALMARAGFDAAEREATTGAEVACLQRSRYDEVSCRIALARVHIRQGDAQALDLAEQSLALAQAVMDDFAINVFRPDLHECRGRIAILRGDVDEGRTQIKRAIDLLTAVDAPIRVERLSAEFFP